jgi:lipopolysaccharide/colanic/teichoic acid biosynthesis glycosyltransferase
VSGAHYDQAKRAIDIVIASAGLIITAPVQAIIALLVRCRLGSPVLFRQQRPGKDEKVFELVKFRTMKAVDSQAGLVTDEQRMTSFGAKLRSTSLDELPTLWNVLKGDMSLVGPRPLLVQYLERYDDLQRKRHEVRPGITGLVQVSGRNAMSWSEKFELDVRYIDERSFGLDLYIIAKTFTAALFRRGISADGVATMPEFEGGGHDRGS